jgi:hypothetical protein
LQVQTLKGLHEESNESNCKQVKGSDKGRHLDLN